MFRINQKGGTMVEAIAVISIMTVLGISAIKLIGGLFDGFKQNIVTSEIRELQKNGKHLRIADEQTLRDAEKLLNDEFAHVLHIPQQDVPDYIRSRMEREA